MKKLVVGLVAVCAAVAAQAAYVDWQYEGKNAKNDTSWGDSTSAAANGLSAYLLTAADWTSIKDTAKAESDIAGKALDSSTLIYEKTVKSVMYYTTHADGKTTGGARQVSVADGEANYYVILANDSGFSVVADNVKITGYSDPTSMGNGLTPGATVTGATNPAASAFTAYATGGGTDPLPEPTSGLLLLVGGAVLALRRKQK